MIKHNGKISHYVKCKDKSLDIKLNCNNKSVYKFKYKTCIKIFLEIHLLFCF